MLRPLRRQTAFASAALVLTAALSSCGFDPATDRENNIAVGTTNLDGTVDVLSATVVAAESGEAVLIGGLANNDREDEDALVEIVPEQEPTAEGEEQPQVAVGEFEPVELSPLGFANLTEDPISLEGDFEAGGHVRLTMVFESGERVSVNVPVVLNCGPYADVSGVPAGDEVCETAEEAH